eukprot:364389-Chlamydomonas_euryale.AAC.9
MALVRHREALGGWEAWEVREGWEGQEGREAWEGRGGTGSVGRTESMGGTGSMGNMESTGSTGSTGSMGSMGSTGSMGAHLQRVHVTLDGLTVLSVRAVQQAARHTRRCVAMQLSQHACGGRSTCWARTHGHVCMRKCGRKGGGQGGQGGRLRAAAC